MRKGSISPLTPNDHYSGRTAPPNLLEFQFICLFNIYRYRIF